MKIICVGRNYAEHAAELKNDIPDKPLLFIKPDSALIKKGMDFYYPYFSNNIHYEVELVVKIHKVGKHIDERFAHKYFDEIALGIDFTARDIQDELKAKGHPWELAKGFDQAALVGDFIPKSEFDLDNLSFSLEKNGAIVQRGNTSEMIFKINHIISYASKFFTLKKGDLIFTGTPAGVGKIDIGDILEGFIEGKKNFQIKVK